MSTCYVVHLQLPAATEGLEDAHARNALHLSTRGRPCDAAKAARLESGALAEALLAASVLPLRQRYGDGAALEVQERHEPGQDSAERIASDSNRVREWLASQPPAAAPTPSKSPEPESEQPAAD